MDNFFSWRSREKDAGKSSQIKAKILKSRLSFLGHPRDLASADVYRHTCRGCRRVFHKAQGLVSHVSDQHPHLLGQLEKDLYRSSKAKEIPIKRIMPGRMAAPRGPKRYKMALDMNDNLEIKLEQHEKDTYSDVDSLLKSSTVSLRDADIDSLLESSDNGVLPLESVNLVDSNLKKCDILVKKLLLTEVNNNKVDMSDPSDYSDDDIKIESIAEQSEIEVVNLSMSSHHLSSQPSTWSASDDSESVAELSKLPRLSNVEDKVEWWLETLNNYSCGLDLL